MNFAFLGQVRSLRAPIRLVQSVTGGGATLVLNGVVAGNTLLLIDSYFRIGSTGVGESLPTDSNGTFVASSADAPFLFNGASDIGVGIFHQQNVASGTHTVTPQANTSHNTTLAEFSGLAVSGLFDLAKSAGSTVANHTSQVTGTTATTTQAAELVAIALCVGAATGANPMSIVDPVSGFNRLQLVDNDATSVGTHHSFKVIAATGTQSANESWTATESVITSMGCIATFKGA